MENEVSVSCTEQGCSDLWDFPSNAPLPFFLTKVCSSTEEIFRLNLQICWPVDLRIKCSKCCGIVFIDV
uniref:Uncharacterized protein n=2 Tax=Anguilla anguilla TaxID=7936 RepID=A0A0E9TVS2_ANGAN